MLTLAALGLGLIQIRWSGQPKPPIPEPGTASGCQPSIVTTR